MKELKEGLLKIGELAKAAGVSVSTVKFYVKEGLIRPACKTGRNMAYYDPACAATIGMIRMLQKERFYPLSVIKRLLETSSAGAMELELLDAIHKVDYQSAGELVPQAEAARQTRLNAAQITALADAGVLAPKRDGRKKLYTTTDLSVMALVRRRLDAGIPFEQSVRSFGIYERALQDAVRADVDAMAAALMVPDFTAEAGAQMIRTSDETLDAFVALRRKALNREYGSRRLEDLDAFAAALKLALGQTAQCFDDCGMAVEASLCSRILAGEPTGLEPLDQAAEQFWGFARDADIAKCIAASVRSRAYFTALAPSGAGAAVACCLKALWLSLAPEILDCAAAAETARQEMAGCLDGPLCSAVTVCVRAAGGKQ